ncbi:MAG: hypothetical protein IJF03_03365 [Lachnospiraceae bacterium]|nr:hypothetical protein [Lachnospiraceae bacterium]
MFIKAYGVHIGSISDGEQLLQSIEEGKKPEEICVSKIEEIASNRKYRRMDRISLLVELCATQLMESWPGERCENKRFGSILNTSYGCIDTNLTFIEEFQSGDVGQLSAIDFSHTVYNAALGHMCKNHHLEGPSTLMLSSNHLFEAEQFLKKDKADRIVSGGAEILPLEIQEYYEKLNVNVTESACLLGLEAKSGSDDLAEIVDFNGVNLFHHPYMDQEKQDSQEDIQRIKKNIEMLKERNHELFDSIDLVVTSSAAALNPDIKKEAEKYFEGKTIVSPYEVLGETLGAALAINILYAALKLKKENLHTALVGNYDITGEYITYLIRR